MQPQPNAAGRRRSGATLVGVGAAVVAVVAAVLAALGARDASAAERRDAVRTEALAAARQIAVDFAAYDYRHLAQDFKRVAEESTGKFREQYLTQSTGVKELIEKAKAVSEAEVVAAGVVSATPQRATVVVALDRTVKNKTVPGGQTDSFGLQMVLLNRGGEWLASEVQPL